MASALGYQVNMEISLDIRVRGSSVLADYVGGTGDPASTLGVGSSVIAYNHGLSGRSDSLVPTAIWVEIMMLGPQLFLVLACCYVSACDGSGVAGSLLPASGVKGQVFIIGFRKCWRWSYGL